MITGPDDSNYIDRICAGLSTGAVMHCIHAPWVAPFVPSLAGETAHGIVAWTLILLSIVAVLKGWSVHRASRVFAWALPGWFCLITARNGSASGSGEIAEIFLTATAGVVLWVTHHLNRSLAYWHHRS